MNPVALAWLAEGVLITWRGASQGKYAKNPLPHIPLPSEYVASFIIFGALSMFSGQAQRPATAAAWGIVLATALNLWDPTTGKIVGANSSTTANATTTAQQSAPSTKVTAA